MVTGFGRSAACAAGLGDPFSLGKWGHILFTRRRRPLFECPALCAGTDTGTNAGSYTFSHPGTHTGVYPKTYAGANTCAYRRTYRKANTCANSS